MSALLAARCNGRPIGPGGVTLDPTARGLTLGEGVFETLLVLNGRAAWRTAHLDRLETAAKFLGLHVSRPTLEDELDAILPLGEHGILRMTLSAGTAPRGLARFAEEPHGLLLTLAPLPANMFFQPLRAITATIRRNESSPASRLKSLSYIDNILAAREAQAKGCDDALMLNTAGNLACATMANVFVAGDGQFVTPPLSDGVLPGIARAVLLNAGVAVEAQIDAQKLSQCPAMFLTNSLRLVMPVTALDGKELPRQTPEDIRDVLCTSIARDCGIDPRELRTAR